MLSKLSTLSNDFLFRFFTGSIPGLITMIFSCFTPISIAKFLVYSEFAIIFSTLFKTSNKRLFIEEPFL